MGSDLKNAMGPSGSGEAGDVQSHWSDEEETGRKGLAGESTIFPV